jgi:hypothetical protein
LGAPNNPNEIHSCRKKNALVQGPQCNGQSECDSSTTCHGKNVLGFVPRMSVSIRTCQYKRNPVTLLASDFTRLTRANPNDISVMLESLSPIRNGRWRERVRLPDADAGKADVEMLSRRPGFSMLIVEVRSPHHRLAQTP